MAQDHTRPVEAAVTPPVVVGDTRRRRDEMSVERAGEAERAHRDRTREFIRAGVSCVLWCLIGLFCLMWSAHTTDAGYGRIAFYGGLVIGNGGILYTLIELYSRREE